MKATTTNAIKILGEKYKLRDNTDMLSKRNTPAPEQKNLFAALISKTPIANGCSIGLIIISPPSLNLA